MAQMQAKWAKLKGEKKGKPRHGLRGERCGNRLMMIIEEPVSRQARSMTAHHKRVIARCPICKDDYRITLGPAN